MKGLRLVFTACLAAAVGCSVVIGGPSAATAVLGETDTPADAPPVVQVRDFPHSSVVSVVAWEADDPAIGLRTSVSRKGELVGGLRFGDHRLYMTPLYAQDMGGFKYAAVTRGQLLLSAGSERDFYSCFYGDACSPMTTVGVRIPDEVLRAHRDSLVVTFYPTLLDPWTVTLRRELITAYLEKVDSLVAEMKKTDMM